MNDDNTSDKDKESPVKDKRHGFGVTLVCFSILIFWIGGIGACSSLGRIGATIYFPVCSIMTFIGMVLGMGLILRNETKVNSIGIFKYILMLTCVATFMLFISTMLFIFGDR